MRKMIFLTILVSLLLGASLPLLAQELTAKEILDKVEETMGAPKDQTLHMKMSLIDKNDRLEESREFMMMQKGKDMRTGKFLSPASQRGIGFLSLSDDVFFVYLPAFRKTQRIATQQKSGNFAGTDFSYQDLGAQNYTTGWDSQLSSIDDDNYYIDLLASNDNDTGYARLSLTIDKATYYPIKVEFYEQLDKASKILTSSQLENISGYTIARKMEMLNVANGHKTVMSLEKAEYDTGLSDDYFTERYLSR